MKKCAKPKVKRRKRKSHAAAATGISGGQPTQRRDRRSAASAAARSVSASSSSRSPGGKRKPVPKARHASKPRLQPSHRDNRAARSTALVSYPREDRNALALLLTPFLIMAVALGTVQQWRGPFNGGVAAIAPLPPAPHRAIPTSEPKIADNSTSSKFPLPPLELDTAHLLPAPGATKSATGMPPISGQLIYPKSAPEIETAGLDLRLPMLRMPLSAPASEARRPVPTAPASESVAVMPPIPGELRYPTSAPEIETASLDTRVPHLRMPPSAPDMGTRPAPPTAPVEPDATAMCDAPAAKLASFSTATGSRRGELGPRVAASDPEAFGLALAQAAREQTKGFVIYTARYRRMAYPLGDVASLYGVCTDVVIRAYRAVGIDLQVLVQKARAGSGDPSIDHRRTATLGRFFARQGASQPITAFPEDYKPGDIVTYHRPFGRISNAHIAVVSDVLAASGRPMVVHNRGYGPQLEDALFADRITGHYRYSGPKTEPLASRPVPVRTGHGVVKASFLPLADVGSHRSFDN